MSRKAYSLLLTAILATGCARTVHFEPAPTPVRPPPPATVAIPLSPAAGQRAVAALDSAPAAQPAPVPAPAAPVVSPPAIPDRLTPGEQLQYTILWFGIPVLRGELRIADQPTPVAGQPHHEVVGKVWSTGLVRRLFVVDDQVSALIDPKTLLSAQSQLTLKHRARMTTETIVFDHRRHHAISTTAKTETITIPRQARDLLSAIYYLRTTDLAEDRPIATKIVASGKVWDLGATIQRRGTLTLGPRTFPVFEVEVKASWLEQYVRHQSLWVWVTTDPTHTPLMVRIKIPVIGTLTALLDDRLPAWPPEAPDVNTN